MNMTQSGLQNKIQKSAAFAVKLEDASHQGKQYRPWMKKYIFPVYIAFSIIVVLTSCIKTVEDPLEVNRIPAIFPDYTGIVIPPNIAPLNFKINEKGTGFLVKIYISNKKPMTIRSKTSVISININKWHKLLLEGSGSSLYTQIFVKGEGGEWQKFQVIKNEISTEKIDSHLAYRLINTGYVLWTTLGIYQRDLECFREKPILENKSIGYGCLNCHSFAKNDPDKIMLHIRKYHGGTIIYRDGETKKVNLKTDYTLSAGVYPSWHPDGNHIAYSVNKINQFFFSGDIRIEVADQFSDIIVYDIEKNTVTTTEKISSENRENLPAWSPDGKYLYFISAPPVTDVEDRISGRYSLLRIAFDVETNQFGEVDTILSSSKTGKSISFPKVSPNGKFLMFTMTDHGYFTIHHPMADLYLLNLETGEYKEMEINSPQTESYHSFSSSGKWFVFSSKRIDGLYTRPYFAYLYSDGKTSKPFILPQKDPDFYHSFIKNYNVPELITREVKISPLAIRDNVLKEAIPAKIHPSVDTLYMKAHLAKMAK